jgi:hypothetical protein
VIRISHDHVLSWDGPKCRWICAVSDCEYFVDDERFSASFLAAVSPERMQAATDQLERLVTGYPEGESDS